MSLVTGELAVREEIVNLAGKSWNNFIHTRYVNAVTERHDSSYPPYSIIYHISGLVLTDLVDGNGNNPKLFFGINSPGPYHYNHFSGVDGYGGTNGEGLSAGTELPGVAAAPGPMGLNTQTGLGANALTYRVSDGAGNDRHFTRGMVLFMVHYYSPVRIQ